jgi:two-component system nitrate/nitrite response regulator NarL
LIKILIVDDHAIFREGLKAILAKNSDLLVVGEADDGDKAVTEAVKLQPDIVLMDINMPHGGLQATKDILTKMPEMKILMLSISEKEDDLHEAVKAGARGYVIKGVGIEELVGSIKSVAAGAAIFTPVMASKLLDSFSSTQKKSRDNISLTEREVEVLKLVSDGATNKEIAARLFVSEPTVKTHLRNILGKLHLKNRSQAAVYASQKEWLDNPPQQ